MKSHKTVEALLREIDRLSDDAQAQLVEAVVAMHYPHLGIYQAQDSDAVTH